MPTTFPSPRRVLGLAGRGGRRRVHATPDSLLCLALCNWCRNLALCRGRRWKVAGMGGGRKQLIAMVTSIFAKFFTSIWFHFQPFHLAKGTSLDVSGCISRGRRRGGLEEACGRWETGALCLPAPDTKPDIESNRLTSCPSISHLAQLVRDVLSDGIRMVFSQSDTKEGLPRPGL